MQTPFRIQAEGQTQISIYGSSYSTGSPLKMQIPCKWGCEKWLADIASSNLTKRGNTSMTQKEQGDTVLVKGKTLQTKAWNWQNHSCFLTSQPVYCTQHLGFQVIKRALTFHLLDIPYRITLSMPVVNKEGQKVEVSNNLVHTLHYKTTERQFWRLCFILVHIFITHLIRMGPVK